MRRRRLIGGALALGASVVAADVLPTAAPKADTAAGPRTAWPETGARDTRVGVVFRTSPARREIALTFDDGPDPRWTPRVLDALAAQDAKATFFVVGMRAQRHPDLVRRIAAAGHVIGNHTYRHADLTRLGHSAITAELRRTSECIAEITGRRPQLLRPPWGHIDPVGLLAAAEAGLTMILWSQHVRASNAGSDAAVCLKDARPGSIVLSHDGGPTPNEVLMRTMAQLTVTLRSRGYDLVSVVDLLRSP